MKKTFAVVALFAAFSCLTACQSNPAKTASANTTTNTATQESLAAKQQEYDQLLQEWKNLKPGLERLLAIESELNLLLGQLAQLSQALEQQPQGQAQVAQVPTEQPLPAAPAAVQPTPSPVGDTTDMSLTQTSVTQAETPIATSITPVALDETTTTNAPVISSQVQTTQDANYALQVASITEIEKLPRVWAQMLSKNPELLAELEPNFQKVQIKNTDYYRLKLGGFATQQQAIQKCSHLKAAGVTCLVVDYTASDFAQLSDQAIATGTNSAYPSVAAHP